jgi:peptidoglycan glycosyltransferase
MALAAAAVANGGIIMKPHVMDHVTDQDGNVIERWVNAPWLTVMSPATAATMRDLMIGVVQNGTAKGMQIPGVQVAAKTGTAEVDKSPPTSNAWMVAFAPADAPRIAVAVIVERLPGVGNDTTGGRIAAPIAKAVIQAVLGLP